MRALIYKIAILYAVITITASCVSLFFGLKFLFAFGTSFFRDKATAWFDLPAGTFLTLMGLAFGITAWILFLGSKNRNHPREPIIARSSVGNTTASTILLLGSILSLLVLAPALFFLAPDAPRWICEGIPCILATLFLIAFLTESYFAKILRNRKAKASRPIAD